MISAIHSFLNVALTAECSSLDDLIRALDLLVVAYNDTEETDLSEGDQEAPREEYTHIVKRVRERFPTLGVYGVVFNPLAIPPEAPVLGDAADDIADIALDLSEVVWRNSSMGFADACWYFRWLYQIHWGKHLHEVRTYLYASKFAL